LDTLLGCSQKILKEILYCQRFLRHNQNGLSKKYSILFLNFRESQKGTAGALLLAMLRRAGCERRQKKTRLKNQEIFSAVFLVLNICFFAPACVREHAYAGKQKM